MQKPELMDYYKEFLLTFNRIEKYLDSYNNSDRPMPFYKLVNWGKKKNKVVQRYESELKSMADLRNILVHENTGNPIAIPSGNTVELIKHIEEELLTPKKINQLFDSRLITIDIESTLANVLHTIRMYQFSQFPVVDGDVFIGLLTENAMINWLANNIEEDSISLKETKIRDILEKDEKKNLFVYLNEDASLYEALEEFEKGRIKNIRKFTIVVLNKDVDKSKTIKVEDIYCLLTPWDLEKIYREISNLNNGNI